MVEEYKYSKKYTQIFYSTNDTEVGGDPYCGDYRLLHQFLLKFFYQKFPYTTHTREASKALNYVYIQKIQCAQVG